MLSKLKAFFAANNIQRRLLLIISMFIFSSIILVSLFSHLRFVADYTDQSAKDIQQVVGRWGEIEAGYFVTGRGEFGHDKFSDPARPAGDHDPHGSRSLWCLLESSSMTSSHTNFRQARANCP